MRRQRFILNTCPSSLDRLVLTRQTTLWVADKSLSLELVLQQITNEWAPLRACLKKWAVNVSTPPAPPLTLGDSKQQSYKDCMTLAYHHALPASEVDATTVTLSYADLKSTKQTFSGCSACLCLSKTCCRAKS